MAGNDNDVDVDDEGAGDVEKKRKQSKDICWPRNLLLRRANKETSFSIINSCVSL